MKPRWMLVAALALGAWALSPARADASNSPRVGTAGGQELRIPVGPRGTALSGAAVADAEGVEALYWNPAGVSRAGGTEVLMSTMSYLVDARVHYFGLARDLGRLGSLGAAVKVVAVGDIDVTTEEAGGATGETFSPTFTVAGVTYGRRLTERVALGATVNLVSESVRNERAMGVAFDVGLQYEIPMRGIRLGAAMKNFGPSMHFTGPDFGLAVAMPGADPSASSRTVVTESASFELPGAFLVGASYDAFEDENGRLRLVTAFQSGTFSSDAYRFGAEYAWRGTLYARAGASAAPDQDDVWGATFGGGLRAFLGGTSLLVDYTRQSSSPFFDDQDMVSLALRF